MHRKTIRHIVLTVPTVVLISLLAFAQLYFSPGDAAMMALRERTNIATLTPEDAAIFAESKGLNKSFAKLYCNWLGNVLQGDLGTSYVDGKNINATVYQATAKTLKMAIIAWFVYLLTGITLGMLSAMNHNGLVDRFTQYWAVLSASIPVFWISMFAVWLLSVKWGLLTTVGKRSDFSLIFPGVLMGLVYAGNLIVLAKEKTLLVLKEPFVLGARALGIPRSVIVRTHVLKNMIAPVIAASVLAFSSFVGSTILMENIFSLSGFGTLMRKAIQTKDYMIVASSTLVIGVLVCMVNLLADIAYTLMDRRNGEREHS